MPKRNSEVDDWGEWPLAPEPDDWADSLAGPQPKISTLAEVAAFVRGLEQPEPEPEPKVERWSRLNTCTYWAEVFGVSRRQFYRMRYPRGPIVTRKVGGLTQIRADCLPPGYVEKQK